MDWKRISVFVISGDKFLTLMSIIVWSMHHIHLIQKILAYQSVYSFL